MEKSSFGVYPLVIEESVNLLKDVVYYTIPLNNEEYVEIEKTSDNIYKILIDSPIIEDGSLHNIRLVADKIGNDTCVMKKYNTNNTLLETRKLDITSTEPKEKTLGLSFKYKVDPVYYSSLNKYYFNFPRSTCGIFPIVSNYIYYDPILIDKYNYYDLNYTTSSGDLYTHTKLKRGISAFSSDEEIIAFIDSLKYEYGSDTAKQSWYGNDEAIKNSAFINNIKKSSSPNEYILKNDEIMFEFCHHNSVNGNNYSMLAACGSHMKNATGMNGYRDESPTAYPTLFNITLTLHSKGTGNNDDNITGYILYYTGRNTWTGANYQYDLSNGTVNNNCCRMISKTNYTNNTKIANYGFFPNHDIEIIRGIFMANIYWENNTPTINGRLLREQSMVAK